MANCCCLPDICKLVSMLSLKIEFASQSNYSLTRNGVCHNLLHITREPTATAKLKNFVLGIKLEFFAILVENRPCCGY